MLWSESMVVWLTRSESVSNEVSCLEVSIYLPGLYDVPQKVQFDRPLCWERRRRHLKEWQSLRRLLPNHRSNIKEIDMVRRHLAAGLALLSLAICLSTPVAAQT